MLALIVAGGICAALLAGLTAQILTIVLLSLGLGGAVLLVFLEVGLGEDRERAAQEAQRRSSERRRAERRRSLPPWRHSRRPR